MSLIEVFIIGIGLSMDAFAVAICKGLSFREMNWKNAIVVGIYFGVFQAVMPLIGYFLGSGFKDFITEYDHWVAFILLAIIGLGMIKESRDEAEQNPELAFKTMVLLAIATSIDAFAVGISFAFLGVNIYSAVLLIGLTTFAFSMGGFKIGNAFGSKYKKKAEIAGGIILILIGLKILFEHLGVI